VPLLEEVLCDATRPSSLQSQPSLNREGESLASLPEEIICACGVDVAQMAETLRSLPEEIPGPIARVMSRQVDPTHLADTLSSLPEEIFAPSTRALSREVDMLHRDDIVEALLEEIPALSPNDLQPMEPHVLIDELLPLDSEFSPSARLEDNVIEEAVMSLKENQLSEPEHSAEVDEESACNRPLTSDTAGTKGLVTPGAESAEELLVLAASIHEEPVFSPVAYDAAAAEDAGVREDISAAAEELLVLAASIHEEPVFGSPTMDQAAAADDAGIREDIADTAEELLALGSPIAEEPTFGSPTSHHATAAHAMGIKEDIADAAEDLLAFASSIREEPVLGNPIMDRPAVADDACIKEDIADTAEDLLALATAVDYDAAADAAGFREDIADDAEDLLAFATSIKEEPVFRSPAADHDAAADDAGIKEDIINDAEDLLAVAASTKEEPVFDNPTVDHAAADGNAGSREPTAVADEDLLALAMSIQKDGPVLGSQSVHDVAAADDAGVREDIDTAEDLLALAASIRDEPVDGSPAEGDAAAADDAGGRQDIADAAQDLLAFATASHEEESVRSHPAANNATAVCMQEDDGDADDMLALAASIHRQESAAHHADHHQESTAILPKPAATPSLENDAVVAQDSDTPEICGDDAEELLILAASAHNGSLCGQALDNAVDAAAVHDKPACGLLAPIDATVVQGAETSNDADAIAEFEVWASAVEDGGNSAEDNLQALAAEILEESACLQPSANDPTSVQSDAVETIPPVSSEAAAGPVQAGKGSDRQRRDSDSRRRAQSTSAINAAVVEPSRRRSSGSSALPRPRSGSPRRLGPDAVMPVIKGVQWKQEEAARKEARDDYLREYMKAHRPTAVRSSVAGRPDHAMPVLQQAHINLLDEEYTRSKQASSAHANAKQRAGGRAGHSSAVHGHAKQGPTKAVSPSLQSAGNAIVRPKT